MPSDFTLPPVGFGPGSQPDPAGEGAAEYMPMPQDMRTYMPSTPEVTDSTALPPVLALLDRVAEACQRVSQGGAAEMFDVATMPAGARRLLAETLSDGEVAAKIRTVPAIAAQESVFAGVWSLRGSGLDAIEVAPIPGAVQTDHPPQRAAVPGGPVRGPGVLNAPPLLAELEDKSATWSPRARLHVINLSLLPHTEQDLDWLDRACGRGAVEILSRGYGNCRITQTALPHVWRVQFFNSMDTLILDTFEVTSVPEVALAASEDLSDSAARIREVRGAIA